MAEFEELKRLPFIIDQLEAIQELAVGFRDWNPMDSRDAGEVYPASSVEDLLDDVRRLADDALTARTTKNGDNK